MRKATQGALTNCNSGLPACLPLRLLKFLAVLVLASAGFSSAQTALSSRSEVIGQLQKGNNQAALLLAEKRLKRTPRDCALLSLQAIALVNLQQPQVALKSFQQALSNCPVYLPALEGAAQIVYAGNRPEARPLLGRILNAQPENVTAHAMLATILRAEGDCLAALPHFASSSGLFNSRPDLLLSYGACLAYTGDLASALTRYQQLLILQPSETVRYDVALLQWKTHANDDALTTLAPLLIGDRRASVLAFASRIHEDKGDTPQAVALLRESIAASPDSVDNYLDFATIAFNHKSFQVGIDMLNVGLKRLPTAAKLYVARGVLEVQLSKGDDAVADFEQAHRLDPKLSFAQDAVGILQSQQHKSEQSLALFEAQAKQHPEDPLLQYLLAERLSETSTGADSTSLASAIVAAQRATVLDPRYAAALNLLAVLYNRSGQPELAFEQAERALALDPSVQSALYQQLMAVRRSGDAAKIRALTARFEDARKESNHREQNTDRYRLQDVITP